MIKTKSLISFSNHLRIFCALIIQSRAETLESGCRSRACKLRLLRVDRPIHGLYCPRIHCFFNFFAFHHRIERRLSRYPNLAASLSCTLLTVIIIIPTIFVSVAILQQGIAALSNGYEWVTRGGAKEVFDMPIVQSSLQRLDALLPSESINQQELLAKAAATASNLSREMLGLSSRILGDVTGMLINFFLDALCLVLSF